MKPRYENPALYRDNVYKSWQVMAEVVRQVRDECFIAHLEPNPGVGYDCLSLVTRDDQGHLNTRFMMNRNGINSLVGSDIYDNTWKKVASKGPQKVADEIIDLSGLTRGESRQNTNVVRVCDYVVSWIEAHRNQVFNVGPMHWPGGCEHFLELESASVSQSQWPILDHGPEICLGMDGREVERVLATSPSTTVNQTNRGV